MKTLYKIIIFLILVSMTGSSVQAATLNELQQRQVELDRQINESQTQLNSQKKQVTSIQDMVTNLDAQINLTQKEIDSTANKINLKTQAIDQAIANIDQKQKELDVQKAKLFETMKTVYETGEQSTVEIIASSNSLSDVVNRSQYLESLSQNIDQQITAVKAAKQELENQKAGLEKDRNDLNAAKTALDDKRRNFDIEQAQKNRLLSQALVEKNQTQSSLNQMAAERNSISAAIYAQRRAQGGYQGGSSNYSPLSNESYRDYWGFYPRQCTSYAAWYWNEVLGKSWNNTQVGRGSAKYWDEIARTLGYSVSDTPRVGAIISWYGPLYPGDIYGHVAIVEAVHDDGTIDLSEYNYVYSENYSYRTNVDPNHDGAHVYIY